VVANHLRDLLRLLRREPSLQPDPLSDRPPRRGLELAEVKDLERQAAPNCLGEQQVLDRSRPELVVGMQRDLGLAQLEPLKS
jgi:hypothetical protein